MNARLSGLRLESPMANLKLIRRGAVRMWHAPLSTQVGLLEAATYLAFAQVLTKLVPYSRWSRLLGRVGQASEVAELILFLASDRAGWITGATYSIDGGRALTCAR